MRYGLTALLALGLIGCGKPKADQPQPEPTLEIVAPRSTPKPVVITPPAPKTAIEIMQEGRWAKAELRASDLIALDKAVMRYQKNQARYQAIEAMRKNGVPAPVIFALHGRESTWDFSKHLHEGSPLTGRTKYVPKGRPFTPEPPYTFEQSAEDALYKLKDLENKVRWNELGNSLQAIEAYNGTGYQRYHSDVPSPYLWAGTTLYSRGKYVADGKFDANAVDKQLGCAAVLKRLGEREVFLPW